MFRVLFARRLRGVLRVQANGGPHARRTRGTPDARLEAYVQLPHIQEGGGLPPVLSVGQRVCACVCVCLCVCVRGTYLPSRMYGDTSTPD